MEPAAPRRGKLPADRNEPQPRPAIFRALGKAEPPPVVQAGDRTWALWEVFKHDSWAATALYGASDTAIVVKFNRQAPIFLIPMSWLGRWLAAREAWAYERMAGVPGVPPACGPVQVDGRVLPTAFAHQYVEGHPLAKDERPGQLFFEEMESLVRAMHARGMAYLDLNKRENVIVTDDGKPLLVDFQIHFSPPIGLAGLPAVRQVLHHLQESDRYHLLKLRTFHTLGPDAMHGIPVLWSSRLWRFLYVHPVQWLRRRLLVALGIRTGEGLAVSEKTPEKAVRLGLERRAAPTEEPGASPCDSAQPRFFPKR